MIRKIFLKFFTLETFFFFVAFIFNIWLINQGSGFTVPREMLFRSYANVIAPILVFPFILFFFLSGGIYIINNTKIKSLKKRATILSIFCLLSAFSLFFTVQTNPDYGRYYLEANYIAKNGILNFLNNWGTFHYQADFPTIPIIFGIFYSILGKGELSTIIANLFIFFGIIVFTYKTAKKISSEKIGLISIFLLSTTPFILTQTPLLLVDLGETFFVILSTYLLINLTENPSLKKSLFTSLFLFFTFLTKIFSFVFLTPLLICSILYAYYQNKKSLNYLLQSWIYSFILSGIFIFWKINIFKQLLFEFFPLENLMAASYPFIFSIIGLMVITIIFITSVPIKIKQKIRFFSPYFIYAILIFIFIFGKDHAFYLRTIFVATNVPLATIFFFSIFFIFKDKYIPGLMLIPLALAANLTPNYMFKYQLPSYPFIMILTAYALTRLFEEKKQIIILTVIFTYSVTITYFFFLPMIQNHIKNNIRRAALYTNQYHPQKITILFFPIGDYGTELSRYIDEKTKFATPSLALLLEYYSKADVEYQTEEEFLINVNNKNFPDILILTTHLNHPFNINSDLLKVINDYYNEGPTFESANGAGIWRVRLKVLTKKNVGF